MLQRSVVSTLCASSLIGLVSVAAAEGTGPHWSYGGATGPTHWGQLEPEFGSCRSGHAQSPIDIRTSQVEKASLPAIEFAYVPSPLKIVDNGHTIQVNYAPGSFITVEGHRYELAQFHFHRPSEESIDGKRHAMVAHLVHKDSEGHLAVVAVALTPGAINPMVAALWNNLPAHKGHEVDARGVQIDATELLPADRAYYTFAGSLTTPPCSEGVTWFVLKSPSTVSSAEIGRFAQLYPMNARPLQPANQRPVRASQ